MLGPAFASLLLVVVLYSTEFFVISLQPNLWAAAVAMRILLTWMGLYVVFSMQIRNVHSHRGDPVSGIVKAVLCLLAIIVAPAVSINGSVLWSVVPSYIARFPQQIIAVNEVLILLSALTPLAVSLRECFSRPVHQEKTPAKDEHLRSQLSSLKSDFDELRNLVELQAEEIAELKLRNDMRAKRAEVETKPAQPPKKNTDFLKVLHSGLSEGTTK